MKVPDMKVDVCLDPEAAAEMRRAAWRHYASAALTALLGAPTASGECASPSKLSAEYADRMLQLEAERFPAKAGAVSWEMYADAVNRCIELEERLGSQALRGPPDNRTVLLGAQIAEERSRAYAIVEHELRSKRIDSLTLNASQVTPSRRMPDGTYLNAKAQPTLIEAVDTLGKRA